MTQDGFVNPDTLLDFITRIKTLNDTYKNVQLKSIYAQRSNVIMTDTKLPFVLVEIINSYIEINKKINLSVNIERTIIDAQGYFNNINDYDQQLCIQYVFSVDELVNCPLEFVCNINFKRVHFGCWNDIAYKSSLMCSKMFPKNTLETKTAKFKKNFKNTAGVSCWSDYLREIFKDPCKYFSMHRIEKNENTLRFNEDIDINYNLFFNCASEVAQTHNIIKHESPNDHKYKNKIYITEECRYDKESKCFTQVLVTPQEIKLMQFIIKDQEKLLNIITICKLLFEIINNTTKLMCDNYLWVQQIISTNEH